VEQPWAIVMELRHPLLSQANSANFRRIGSKDRSISDSFESKDHPIPNFGSNTHSIADGNDLEVYGVWNLFPVPIDAKHPQASS
jgi:hypothetical protein